MERVIGLMKQKFTILHVQLRYIAYFIDKKTSRYSCGTIDKIIVVIAALVNFCNSVTTCMNYDLYVLFNFIQFKHSILIYKHHNTTQNQGLSLLLVQHTHNETILLYTREHRKQPLVQRLHVCKCSTHLYCFLLDQLSFVCR